MIEIVTIPCSALLREMVSFSQKHWLPKHLFEDISFYSERASYHQEMVKKMTLSIRLIKHMTQQCWVFLKIELEKSANEEKCYETGLDFAKSAKSKEEHLTNHKALLSRWFQFPKLSFVTSWLSLFLSFRGHEWMSVQSQNRRDIFHIVVYISQVKETKIFDLPQFARWKPWDFMHKRNNGFA